VGIVNQMKAPWQILRDAVFDTSDRHYRRFRRRGSGLYASNGAMLSVVLRSKEDRVHPDLICLSFLTDFRGYEPGYSQRLLRRDCLSWVVLKAHTNNNAGRVELRSADPLEPPRVQFNYFQDGNDASGDDLDAVVTGVKLVRQIADATPELALEEEYPGRHIYTDEQLKDFVRSAAWGHHACGTCAMKPQADGGVVDSEFRVYGIDGLRIVDASVLPRIPGFFIVASIYMIAEKAADVILQGSGAPAVRARSFTQTTHIQQSHPRETASHGVAARDRDASRSEPATQQ
jgi:choline dehydrogenase